MNELEKEVRVISLQVIGRLFGVYKKLTLDLNDGAGNHKGCWKDLHDFPSWEKLQNA